MAAAVAEAVGLEPRSVEEARKHPDWPKWKDMIEAELRQLDAMGTWEIADKPAGVNIVGSKWVFKVKKDVARNVERYKARLVAQGFTQVPGVDYFDTFAPVAKLASIRTVLALAARHDWEIHQVDIKSAYLNGEFEDDEVIYMRQPPGFLISDQPGKVLRLRCPLYGLKQSGHRWYEKLRQLLVDAGFRHCESDHAVFTKHSEEGLGIITVHVDDMMIAASSSNLLQEIKRQLKGKVEISDLGEIHWLLGFEVQ